MTSEKRNKLYSVGEAVLVPQRVRGLWRDGRISYWSGVICSAPIKCKHGNRYYVQISPKPADTPWLHFIHEAHLKPEPHTVPKWKPTPSQLADELDRIYPTARDLAGRLVRFIEKDTKASGEVFTIIAQNKTRFAKDLGISKSGVATSHDLRSALDLLFGLIFDGHRYISGFSEVEDRDNKIKGPKPKYWLIGTTPISNPSRFGGES